MRRSTALVRRALWVRLVLVVALALTATVADAQYFGRNKITYREFEWKIYHSPHFDVYYYAESEVLLEKVVSLAESAYDRLSRDFDFKIQEPTPLIFYGTHSAFEQNNIILNFIPEGVGAFASPGRFRMVLPTDMPDGELYDLILHELTHIFQYHMLFQGSLSKAVGTRPPTWFMEGMASYMAKDEETWDRMYLRDAVVNDQIPRITQGVEGYFAYRFGHAVFDFIEEKWGKDGFLDFFYEFRNTIGSRVDRAVERTFKMDPEDFDMEFRRWLRKKYLPELIETGEPSDFGRPFRIEDRTITQATSPVASPSGDLVAALSAFDGEPDVVLFETKNRRFVRNLTRGFSDDYQYVTGQFQTIGRVMGRDLAFSPDGNTVAVFVKRESGRSLLLVDVLEGGDHELIDMAGLGVEQQLAPAFTPDGRALLFSAWRNGQFDIFRYEFAGGALSNLTEDAVYDGAPTVSPDGKSMVITSVVGNHQQLFRVDFADPKVRFRLSDGEWNDRDAVYSADGKRLYFTSDRSGAENIYSLNLETGEVAQHTNAVTGAFMPYPIRDLDGKERLIYNGFWRRDFDLYLADLETQIGEPHQVELPTAGAAPSELAKFEPDIQVNIDPANTEDYGGFKLFLENAQTLVGVDSDQTFQGQILLSFTDYLGDRRLFVLFSAVDSFSNFDIQYLNREKRLQWAVRLYDDRSFFVSRNFVTNRIERGRSAYRETGAEASLIYPFNLSYRVEAGLGYIFRDIDYQFFVEDPNTGESRPIVLPRSDDYPQVSAALVGDTTLYAPWGPITGHRWRLSGSYAPDLDESGALTSTVSVDARKYFKVTDRSNFAVRAVVQASQGNFPQPIFFGGLDTLRGFDRYSIVGDRGGFANVEFRFPLIDVLATPVLVFQNIRGVLFFDVGGAYFEAEDFKFYDSDTKRLVNGVSAYGIGMSLRFLGLDLNWDLAKQWDFKDTEGSYRTTFWIGTRF